MGDASNQAARSERLQDAVIALVHAPTWIASRQVMRAEQAWLLTPDADAVFQTLLDGNAADVRAVMLLAHRRALVARAAEIGIDEAYADLITPDYVDSLRKELNTLPDAEPRRVDVGRALLATSDNLDAPQRAELQVELAKSSSTCVTTLRDRISAKRSTCWARQRRSWSASAARSTGPERVTLLPSHGCADGATTASGTCSRQFSVPPTQQTSGVAPPSAWLLRRLCTCSDLPTSNGRRGGIPRFQMQPLAFAKRSACSPRTKGPDCGPPYLSDPGYFTATNESCSRPG